MKYFTLIFLFSVAEANTSTALLKKPKFLKSLVFQTNIESSDNFARVDKDLIDSNSSIDTKGLENQTINYSLSSVMKFKPLKKGFLINKNKISFSHQPIDAFDGAINPSRINPRNTFMLDNDLLAIYLINKKNQIGLYNHFVYSSGDSFQINPSVPQDYKLLTINEDHFKIGQSFFYQHRFNKVYSSRLTIGAKLAEYDSDYSVFKETQGEQNDNLLTRGLIDNNFKISKNAFLKIPLSYEKTYYKTRFALKKDGNFQTIGLKKRETLEKFQVVPNLKLSSKYIDFSIGLGLARQRDLSYGARDYSGHVTNLSSNIKFERFSLNPYYSFSKFDYSNAKNLDGSSWLESTTKFGVQLTAYNLFSPLLTGNLGLEKEEAKDNFFAGKYSNTKLSAGLSINL